MTKERLRKFRDLKAERDDLLEQIEELETMLYGPKGQNLDGMPRGGGGDNGAREAKLDKLKPLREKYNAKVMEMTAELEAIEASIEPLEPRERRLIRLYYFKGLTWEQVAVEMNYSWRQVHNIHGMALEQLRTEEEVAGA